MAVCDERLHVIGVRGRDVLPVLVIRWKLSVWLDSHNKPPHPRTCNTKTVCFPQPKLIPRKHLAHLLGQYTLAIMAHGDKHELGLLEVAHQTSTSSAALSNIRRDQSLLEKQTRTLRLFSRSQLFAFSLVYLGTGYYVAGLVHPS